MCEIGRVLATRCRAFINQLPGCAGPCRCGWHSQGICMAKQPATLWQASDTGRHSAADQQRMQGDTTWKGRTVSAWLSFRMRAYEHQRSACACGTEQREVSLQCCLATL